MGEGCACAASVLGGVAVEGEEGCACAASVLDGVVVDWGEGAGEGGPGPVGCQVPRSLLLCVLLLLSLLRLRSLLLCMLLLSLLGLRSLLLPLLTPAPTPLSLLLLAS